LSYIGEPFEYDVFVSYAHAEAETEAPDMRLWCRHVAERLRIRLANALNRGNPSSDVRIFLDDRVLRSGEPLTETLRDKAQRSALLLIFMSPLYSKKTWCLDELEWFFGQADEDGRCQRHCTVLRIQELRDTDWPKRLRDERNKPIIFHDLLDRNAGLPIGFDNYELQALKDAIRAVQIELKGKLEGLRAQYEARRIYQQATQPVLYLQARPHELPDWQDTRAALEPYAIVYPDSRPEPISDDALLEEQRARRLKEYAECDGLVLLHASSDETFRVEVMAAYKDRQHLFQRLHRILPWAVVDRRGDVPPVYSAYRVPCIAASGPDWPNQLVQALGVNTGRSS
jgi:hypothetical protein